MSSKEIRQEQDYLDMLYGRLDGLRDQARARLAEVLATRDTSHQGRAQRDAEAAQYTGEITRLDHVEQGLCFGRLDFRDDERRYIGRLGIFDEDDDYQPLLVDWRAPAARPFYAATAASPDGVKRRRYIRTSGRTVTDVDDEVLDWGSPTTGLIGEAALMSALNAERTGRMGDIVQTIQTEQDAIIRAPHNGVLVVHGGPGTGKTAVALHRAAYLLYTYRAELGRRGVLIVGPNQTFLRYIENVLPTLGETGVLLSTIADLFPGVRARGAEPDAVAELKGRPGMAEVIAAAVRDRQAATTEPLDIDVDGDALRLEPGVTRAAADRARATRLPHNQARPVFAREVVDALARQLADKLGDDPFKDDPLGEDDAPGVNLLDEADVDQLRQELARHPAVRAAVDDLWPVLSAQELVADLLADPDRLATAAPGLTPEERARLHRPPGAEWTEADVPLLDEAAELLGADDRAARLRAARERRRRLRYASGVLDLLSRDVDDDLDLNLPTDFVHAELLADLHEEGPEGSVAERAAADRTWMFGHVIVDEAQELSPMAWRMLMRRCPSRSMTLVGDPAQASAPGGGRSWTEILAPFVGDRWRLSRLTVNYRMPAEIMAVAAGLLDSPSEAPRSVRETGVRPWRVAVPPDGLPGRLAALVAQEWPGRLAVLVPADRLAELRAAVPASVTVLPVREAKGLEFDSVLVVEPAAIEATSRGDLYVALTRPTQRLGVLHAGPLPPALEGLRELA